LYSGNNEKPERRITCYYKNYLYNIENGSPMGSRSFASLKAHASFLKD
jgi:hypothetical protein